jgi:hypothetical protein
VLGTPRAALLNGLQFTVATVEHVSRESVPPTVAHELHTAASPPSGVQLPLLLASVPPLLLLLVLEAPLLLEVPLLELLVDVPLLEVLLPPLLPLLPPSPRVIEGGLLLLLPQAAAIEPAMATSATPMIFRRLLLAFIT